MPGEREALPPTAGDTNSNDTPTQHSGHMRANHPTTHGPGMSSPQAQENEMTHAQSSRPPLQGKPHTLTTSTRG